MLTLDKLLTAHSTLKQRNGTQINAQLRQLQQHILAQLHALQQQEEILVADEYELLDPIQDHLARDARSLTGTDAFQAFVRSLFIETADELVCRYLATQIDPDPTIWRLHQLKEPLQIHCTQPFCEEVFDDEGISHTLYLVKMEVQLGRWRDVVDLAPQPLMETAGEFDLPLSGFKQWLKLTEQLKGALRQSPLGFGTQETQGNKRSARQKAVPSQRGVAQEMACVLMFVGELFHSYTVADRLWSLLSAAHGMPQPRSSPPPTAE
ncbi:hypothetical protein [Leptolyngbya sp. NIES-2104]|uniref:hypothetical protein n=1 Tax=Leptolyngbya sp. NIES-2104 TaxID=1552121 RepID=UPI0006EC678A|nr:hypothetical protein [Leptolyngbya sp. NIES-2104]GAP96690.1 hypothetical protein NIES2104_32330 [Leptolyngbya sp. NIES-2104]